MFVRAFDVNVPSEVIQTYVTVTFERNMNAPIFPLGRTSADIYDFDPPGHVVSTLTATDGDPLVSLNNLRSIIFVAELILLFK